MRVSNEVLIEMYTKKELELEDFPKEVLYGMLVVAISKIDLYENVGNMSEEKVAEYQDDQRDIMDLIYDRDFITVELIEAFDNLEKESL